jgi:tetratricopeptide repeat protein 8
VPFLGSQPELGMRYFRRLLQMGVNSAELWNNLGLSCFYAAQFDMALNCFDRALNMASDDCMADIWCVQADLLIYHTIIDI